MYKKWLITKNNTITTRVALNKLFFSSLESILTNIGIEFTSRYTYNTSANTNNRDCLCIESNLSQMQEKGYPEWIINFSSFPTLIGSRDTTGWKNDSSYKNYSDGFLSFKIGDIDYCFVYNIKYEYGSYAYSQTTLLINLSNSYYKHTLYNKYCFSIQSKGNSGSGDSYSGLGDGEANGLFTASVNDYILVEYHKTSYMELLTFTLNGMNNGNSYYGDGKFLALGYYKIADGLNLAFPAGLICGENSQESYFNNLTFQTDAEGLFRLSNAIEGDFINGNYIKGNINYGIVNQGVLGTLQNAITINNYEYLPDTRFTIGNNEYAKLRIPYIDNKQYASKNYANNSTALSMAFHKMEG